MQKNPGLIIIFFITLLVVVGVAVITFMPFSIRENIIHHFRALHPARATSTATTASTSPTTSTTSSDVIVNSPERGAMVSSPLTIVGSAKGNWYFEATFLIKLLNSKGQEIGEGPAQAADDWMTTDYVPFTTTIQFPAQPKGSKGTIVFMKDNPSGDPIRDASTTLSIIF